MHRSKTLVLVGLSLLAVAARPALAQTPDSAAFHKGQWGADFQIGTGFVGVGALHFSSPTRALLLNLVTSYDHTASPDSGAASASHFVGVMVQLGTRAYHRIDRDLYRWTTLGVGANVSQQSGALSGVSSTSHNTVLMLFGNIGATWLVTPHLGLGAEWQASINYTRTSFDVPAASASHVVNQWYLSLGYPQLIGQLYF